MPNINAPEKKARITFEETSLKTGIIVMDGSMSTALEMLGCDLNDSLWTAKVLAEQPELIEKVHLDYFRAGADCGITCSYQATILGLIASGYTEKQAEQYISRSVKLLLKARSEWWETEGKESGRVFPLCLAGIGPYGAYLADGSEYHGKYDISDEDLRNFHQRRIELLWAAGADLLLFETQPSLREVLIEADVAEHMGADYWISFSCKDGKHINEGTAISSCAEVLRYGHPHLKVIGVNCTSPCFVDSLIKELKNSCSLPIAVYPNSGEQYDAVTKKWNGHCDGISFCDYAKRWMLTGASAVGGCCRTTAYHVEEIVCARMAFQMPDL